MIQGSVPSVGGGLQAAAAALQGVDLGQDSADPLERRVKEISGSAEAKALSTLVRVAEENLGTILDLKA